MSGHTPLVAPAEAGLRIGNCSGFYGDRLSAMREMLEGGNLDVITGDYLAELTMLILGKDAMRDERLGYAKTFLAQLEDCLGIALERGVKIVSNAGGLNPAGLAEAVRDLARGLGIDANVAHLEGDDLRGSGHFDAALTANAYLGGFGIAAALSAGADVVVTGRVTDASVVVGPAIEQFGWNQTDFDQLAGATVAGHIIECGTQATGGNFAGFLDLMKQGWPMGRPLGFPIAEIAADGSCVITKHEGTGGAVTLDTVTAQLLYEIQTQHYLGPDVTTRLDTIDVSQEATDRVRISGVRGLAPPEQIKVATNHLGGWRNRMEFVITGLDAREKADWLKQQLTPRLTAADVTWSDVLTPRPNAETEEGASILLRCTVTDPDADTVGKAFTGPAVDLALASYPGFTMTSPPGKSTPYGIYRPAYVDRDVVEQVVVHGDGRREVIPHPSHTESPLESSDSPAAVSQQRKSTDAVRVPLGTFVYARSGDKGGDANLGLWVKQDEQPYAERVEWLLAEITQERIRELLPETRDLDIEIYPLPNLGAVNVLVKGLLGEGVAASTRFDPQAKGLGEWARSRMVDVPAGLVSTNSDDSEEH